MQRTDADLVRTIRHGVGADGHKIVMMPSSEYVHLSARDVGAVVAYIRSLPPVDRELPPTTYGPVLRGLLVATDVPFFEADHLDHSLAPAPQPVEGPTVEYGRYLVRVSGCQGCHGETLSGGKIPQGDPAWPPAANLTPNGLGKYSEEQFFAVLRTGRRPDGSALNAAMPWKWTAEMTDDETRAIWAYLKTVAPKEFGGR